VDSGRGRRLSTFAAEYRTRESKLSPRTALLTLCAFVVAKMFRSGIYKASPDDFALTCEGKSAGDCQDPFSHIAYSSVIAGEVTALNVIFFCLFS
jgi:hypothetical protein